MTKKQKKEHILTNLSLNHCIISDAIDEVCSREEFDQFYDSDKEFREQVQRLEVKRDDTVRQVQMDLIMSGDSKQVSEYMKDVRSSQGDILGGIQRETMLYIVQHAKNNSETIEAFMRIFNCTKYRANQIFTDCLAQNDLESPTARNKKHEENIEASLYKRFEKGELDELQMYRELVADALRMSQFASREDVRINAGKLVMTYQERLDAVQERIRREAESDDQNIFDKLDAVLAGVTPGEIDALKQKISSNRLELSEVEE